MCKWFVVEKYAATGFHTVPGGETKCFVSFTLLTLLTVSSIVRLLGAISLSLIGGR